MKTDLRNTAMAASLVAAALMLGGKVAAALLTGSVAILSDLLESVIHVAATGMAAFSLWYSRRPADLDHPYGHGKIAYFSAGIEGALILLASLGIFVTSIRSLIFPAPIERLGVGIVIMGALAVVNLLLGLFLMRVGKRQQSTVLVANGQHVLSDMITNVGVVVGILVVWWTGVLWLDSLVAMLVGVQVLAMAVVLMRRAVNGLMERADIHQTERIREVLRQAKADGTLVDWHQLRHRVIEHDIWIEVHLLMGGEQSVRQAHHTVTKLEDDIRLLFPGQRVRITTHIEPSSHDDDHPAGHPDFREEDELF